jgi:hypothetical protein
MRTRTNARTQTGAPAVTEKPSTAFRGVADSTSVRRALLRCCVIACAAAPLACAHGQAKTVAELPPLNMPAPPPRTVEATEPPQPPLVSLPDEQRPNLRPRPAPAQRTETPRAEPPKVEQSAPEPARQTDEPKTAQPPTTLQTTPAQREGEVERRIRVLVAQATNDLNRVNYQALNADARNQYDTAKRFVSQAEDALRSRNLVFASNLADKAAALAAQLLGR